MAGYLGDDHYPNHQEIQEKQEALKQLLIKIDEYFFPDDPRSGSAIATEIVLREIFSYPVVSFFVGFAAFLLFLKWNPLELGTNYAQPSFGWAMLGSLVGAYVTALAARAASSYFFGNPTFQAHIPGIGIVTPNNLDLGDTTLHNLLSTIKMEAADDVYALFGDWKTFHINDVQGPSWNGTPPQSAPSYTIKFQSIAPNLDPINLNKHGTNLWQFFNVNPQGLTEGPCVLFVYCQNRQSERFSGRYAIGLLDLQTWRVVFTEKTCAPYAKKAVVWGLGAAVAVWLGCLLASIASFASFVPSELLTYSMGVFFLTWLVSYWRLSSDFQYQSRQVITDLAMRDNYKRALYTEYMRRAHSEFDESDGLL